MNPLTSALAQAQISDMRRQACRSQLAGVARSARRQRDRGRTARGFSARFLPVPPVLFHH
jgi:hypothetical protein